MALLIRKCRLIAPNTIISCSRSLSNTGGIILPRGGDDSGPTYIPRNKYTEYDIKFKRPHGIRNATEKDLQRLANLVTKTQFGNEEPGYVDYCLQQPHTFRALRDNFPKEKELHKYLVAVYRTKKVGMLEVDARNEMPVLKHFVMASNWRNKGFGAELMRIAETLVADWDVPNLLQLKVRESNQDAVRLFERLGYQTTDTEEETVKKVWRKGKRIEPVLVMTKKL